MANQKTNQEFWMDEAGIKIPFSRITKAERLMERKSALLLKKAINLNEQLKDYKKDIQSICDDVYEAFMAEREIKINSKGNFTWFNFDRSIKVEISVKDRITFDEMGIAAAREKLDTFLDKNLDGKVEFIKDLVNEAFQTSRGRLDTKKVMSLLKYKQKIKQPLFTEAMDLLENSIRRPSSKIYYRIWTKVSDGSYEALELNFSNI